MSKATARRQSATTLPRWVILLGAAFAAILALFVLLHLAGVMPMGHAM